MEARHRPFNGLGLNGIQICPAPSLHDTDMISGVKIRFRYQTKDIQIQNIRIIHQMPRFESVIEKVLKESLIGGFQSTYQLSVALLIKRPIRTLLM